MPSENAEQPESSSPVAATGRDGPDRSWIHEQPEGVANAVACSMASSFSLTEHLAAAESALSAARAEIVSVEVDRDQYLASSRGWQSEASRLAVLLADAKDLMSRPICGCCGYRPESVENIGDVLSEHIFECDKHPLRAVAAELVAARAEVDAVTAERDAAYAVIGKHKFCATNEQMAAYLAGGPAPWEGKSLIELGREVCGLPPTPGTVRDEE